MRNVYILIIAVFITLFLSSQAPAVSREVVVYTALDQLFSEPILQEFEKRYSIKVQPVYDVEAVKTTGLVNRLIAEKNNPRCDVFWNNEIVRTIVLKKKGVLTPYISPEAADIPDTFKDPEGYWTGFGARARVIVVNTELLQPEEYPRSIQELAEPKWRGKAALANPLFGTTATHVAALYALNGKTRTTAFFQAVRTNNTRIVDGNSVVRDMVAAGRVLWGLTDTDDVNIGILQGMPIKALLPDQDSGGTLLIPNTIGLVAKSPNPKEAKLLIDFILSKETEARLCQGESAQIPLRPGIEVVPGHFKQGDIAAINIDFETVAEVIEEATKLSQSIFLR